MSYGLTDTRQRNQRAASITKRRVPGIQLVPGCSCRPSRRSTLLRPPQGRHFRIELGEALCEELESDGCVLIMINYA